MNTKQDRRITKTKAGIKNAFISLLEQNNKIPTVQEITQLANINRSTFYSHYADVHALHQEIEDELIAEIKKMFQTLPAYPDLKNIESLWIYQLFEYMAKEQSIFFLLFKDKSSQFTIKLTNELRQLFIQTMPMVTHTNAIEEYISSFIAYGLVGIMHKWVEDGGVLSAEEITTMSIAFAESSRKVATKK